MSYMEGLRWFVEDNLLRDTFRGIYIEYNKIYMRVCVCAWGFCKRNKSKLKRTSKALSKHVLFMDTVIMDTVIL